MIHIEGVQGNQYLPGEPNYDDKSRQYATEYAVPGADPDMSPGLIVYAKGIDDIRKTLQYAKKQTLAGAPTYVATRTGGHQYSGASSTDKNGILLDLSQTFRDHTNPDESKRDRFIIWDGVGSKRKPIKAFTSVSWSLVEFNEWLGDSQCFVPHGQCSSVHIGGHAQTGGYGQSGRSFGLLGDHIESLVVVDPDDDVAQVKEVRKDNNPDLFFALLGGSPGNLGVVTHLTLTIRRSDDYVGSYGMRAVHFFTQGKLQRFLKLLADMSDNETWPRNFDLCISVLSGNHKPWFHFPDLDHRLREDYPEPGEDNGYNGTPSHIPFTSIIVYAQWCKFEPYETCPTWWFDQFGSWAYAKERGEKPMHELGKWWIMPYTREFDIPYIKRTYVSNSNTLGTSNWPKWTAERCQKITQEDNNCYLCAQIQFFGGQSSQYASNAGNGTAYSWRDARMFATMDAFYDDQAGKAESAKAWAQEWQDTNDAEIRAHGQNMGQFGDKEQRVLWGCYQTKDETKDLDSVHEKYYDDDTYDRLKKIRKAVDPHGIYTPNKFCVKAGD